MPVVGRLWQGDRGEAAVEVSEGTLEGSHEGPGRWEALVASLVLKGREGGRRPPASTQPPSPPPLCKFPLH